MCSVLRPAARRKLIGCLLLLHNGRTADWPTVGAICASAERSQGAAWSGGARCAAWSSGARGAFAKRGHTRPGSRVSGVASRGGRVEAVDQTDMFEAERPRLLGIASRVLGDHVEAHDVVQQAWLPLHGTDADRDGQYARHFE